MATIATERTDPPPPQPFHRRNRRLPLLLLLLGATAWAWSHIRHARINDGLVRAVVSNEPTAVHAALLAGADANLRLPRLHDDSEPFNLFVFLRELLHGRASSRPNNQRSMLMIAASQGNGPICSDLLAHGADWHVRLSNGSTAVLLAARARHPGPLQALLDRGAPVNDRDKHGVTPFLVAVQNGGPDTVGILLDHGADINQRDADGRPAIVDAVEQRRHEIVRLLIQRGADLSLLEQGLTIAPTRGVGFVNSRQGSAVPRRLPTEALSIAAQNGSAELLDALAKTDWGMASMRANGRLALVQSVNSGRYEAVKALLDHGVTADNPDALNLACQQGREDFVVLLLDRGARIEGADAVGRTPLYFACSNSRSSDLIDILLARGADVHAVTRAGETMLTAVVNSPELVKRLLAKGLDVKARSARGESAMSRAYNPESIRLLLEAGADPNDSGPDGGDPPLLRAVWNRASVEALLAKGTDPLRPNRQGETAISRAIDPAIIQILLNRGADPNARSFGGTTPLMSAVQRNDTKSVAVLLEARSNVSLEDQQGRTALSLARQNRNRQIVDMLTGAGAKE